jgi:cell cycle sensor histidine kinase DivJ
MRSQLDALVHPSARGDALIATRHRVFIAPRLLGGLAGLAAFPVYLGLRGVPSVLELGMFAFLAVPLLLTYVLSRTGRLDIAHALSALALAGLITAVAWQTGGIGSFAAIWLVVVPLETALSASRRMVVLASIFALAGAAILLGGEAAGVLPSVPSIAGDTYVPIALALITATIYATGLALASEALARASDRMLDAEEDRYRLLALHMSDVISRHGRDGRVSFISPAAQSLFAVECDLLLGHGLFDRVHVADRPAYLGALSEAAHAREPRSVEFRIRRDDAGRSACFVWVEMRCRPLDQAVIGGDVVAVLRDVSERKAQERAVEEARAESERANAGKSRFLATMSHELRTPLNAIIGFSEMLTDDSISVDPARQREYAKLINDSGRHLLSVVNGILDMSKMESGNFEISPEPFAPGEAIQNCCDILALKASEAGIALQVSLPQDLPEIVADRRALSQVVLNLVSNAIKFSNKGGQIGVGAARDQGHLVITVQDRGVGIGEDDLQRLGEAFFQARASYDRRHDGTGLGLSIVKGLVKLHGGDLTIRSRLGAGTCVTVRLPLDSEGKRAAAQPVPLEKKAIETPMAAETLKVKKRA